MSVKHNIFVEKIIFTSRTVEGARAVIRKSQNSGLLSQIISKIHLFLMSLNLDF